MKYCKISVLGQSFGIFSFAGEPLKKDIHISKSLDNVEPVFLFPSLKLDFYFELSKEKREDTNAYYPALIALAHYFFSVRGLPLSEIETGTPVGNFRLETCGNLYKISADKCKYKFTEKEREIKGCEIRYYESCGDISVLIFEAENVENFDFFVLPESVYLKNEGSTASALVFSLKDASVFVRAFSGASLFSLAMVLSHFLTERGRKIYNEKFQISFSGGEKLVMKALSNGSAELFAKGEFLGFYEI